MSTHGCVTHSCKARVAFAAPSVPARWGKSSITAGRCVPPPLFTFRRRRCSLPPCLAPSRTVRMSTSSAGDPPAAGPSWKCARGEGSVLPAAVREAVRSLGLDFANPPMLVLFFVSGARDARSAHRIVSDELRRVRIPPDAVTVLGCTSEAGPGDSFGEVVVELSAATLPGVVVHPWMVEKVDLDWRQHDWWKIVDCKDVPETAAGVGGASEERVADESDAVGPVFLIFGSVGYPELRIGDLLAGLDFAFPRSPKVGAIAGAPVLAGDACVFGANGNVLESGFVGVALERVERGTAFEVVVAQGARPIGPRVTVTQVKDESEIVMVQEMTGASVSVTTAPMRILDMWTETGIVDKEEVQARMYIGVDIPSAAVAATTPSAASSFVLPSEAPVGDESASDGDPEAVGNGETAPGPGAAPQGTLPGMLVRRVLSVDAETMSVIVSGPPVRLGVGARFHIRDMASVSAEYERLKEIVPKKPVGGVLLSDAARVELAAECGDGGDERSVFGGQVLRLLGDGEVGPLPAPGFQQYFPIREPGSAASTFEHSSCSVYLLVYDEFARDSAEGPGEE